MTYEARDLPTQHNAAVRIAQVRVVLCVVNFLVILLDQSIPNRSTLVAYFEAFTAGLLFFTYAVLAHEGLRTKQIPLRLYHYGAPVFDVICASILIMATNGYLSPFNLWFVFAVVAGGYSNDRRLPYFATILGIVAHSLIALIPQHAPLEISTFAVRTGYLFGFAGVLGALQQSLTAAGSAWASMDTLGQRLSRVFETPDVAQALFQALERIAPVRFAELKFKDGRTYRHGPVGHKFVEPEVFLLLHVGTEIAVLTIDWARPLTDFESSMAGLCCDRAGATLARIQVSEGLMKVAAREERIRLADDLHDSYLQTLAAIDLHVEALRSRAKEDRDLDEGLNEIKNIARQAAKEAREAFTPIAEIQSFGPDEVRQLIATRWAGTYDVSISEELEMSEDYWRIVEMMVREGLNNAAKHGGSAHVAIAVEAQQARYVATLVQFGRSLPENFKLGYGLTRLKEAVERVDGHMTLENLKEGGTTLMVSLPRIACKK